MTTNDDSKTWDFDPWAIRYDAVVKQDDKQYYARYDEVLNMVVEKAQLGTGKHVLDIGTGTGNLALRCLAQGAQVTALDPSENMLAVARTKMPPDAIITFSRVDDPFLKLPFPDDTFDAVVSTYAFHHIPHSQKAACYREMLRVLKPGGRWVLGDLIFENQLAEQVALREFRWLEEEYFTYLDTLRVLFRTMGLEVSAKQFTPVTWVVWAIK